MDTASALTVEDIEFSPLSATEWRVSDRRYSRQEIAALLGFVACKGDEFYLTRMHHPLEVTRLGSLEQVAAFLATAEVSAPDLGAPDLGAPDLEVERATGSRPEFAGS